MKKEKTKTEKNKKGKLLHPAAIAARPKSNAIKEGCCAVGLCVYGGIFWPCQVRLLLCAAAELRVIFFMIVWRGLSYSKALTVFYLHSYQTDSYMDTHIAFEQVVRRGCGMDVHRDTVVATVMGEGIKKETRTYSTYTNALHELKGWLTSVSVTHIAMESTGVYWKPVFNILEADFQILLVNAWHVKNVPGHKTDKKDSVWLTKLLLSGLLKASFIPPREIRDLRDLSRYRRKLTQQATAERNRFEKILQDANFKMSAVISDVFGLTGTKLIDALLSGNNNFDELLELCHGRIKNKKEQLKEALVGHLTSHHKFMLKTIRKSLDGVLGKIALLDAQTMLLSKPYQRELELLQTIPGINKISSVCLLSEIGADMSQFPTEHHLASWAGLCPSANESAGRIKSTRVTQGNQYLRFGGMCLVRFSRQRLLSEKQIRKPDWPKRQEKSVDCCWAQNTHLGISYPQRKGSLQRIGL